MKNQVLAIFMALFIGGVPAHAQVRSSANYAITVDQINSGGGAASSTNYQLRGSIGQPFDTQPMSSANYANRPGFQASSPSPFLTVSPTSVLFGDQTVGVSSAGQGVTLTNSGNVSINLNSIGISGANAGDFGQGGCGGSIAVAGNCVTSVVFTPQAVGPRSGALDISANAPSNATSVALSGTGVGVPGMTTSAGALNFGNRGLGLASAPLSVTVSNVGSASLSYAGLVSGAAAANFVVQPGGCGASGAVAVSGNCQMSVVFTPSALGARTATLTISSNDPANPSDAISLTGTGISRARRDFDGDGRSDILWRNASTGENYLYPMNGVAILAAEGYLRTVTGPWIVAGLGDMDGDGKADVLWRNTSTGQNYIYFMDGKTIKPTEGYIRTVTGPWVVAGLGDMDGDGKDDILWRNTATGENYLYFMDGKTIKPTEGYIRTVAAPWDVAGLGDMDGDGKADVLWRNTSTGQNYLYFMDGKTIKPTEGYTRTVASQAWQVAGVGDYNGDGKDDILWRNTTTGENYLYPMNGLAILAAEGYVRTVADQNWQVKGTGDYDGDGKADVLWRHATTGQNYLYFMDGKTIKPTEGYTRTVPQPNWQVQNPR